MTAGAFWARAVPATHIMPAESTSNETKTANAADGGDSKASTALSASKTAANFTAENDIDAGSDDQGGAKGDAVKTAGTHGGLISQGQVNFRDTGEPGDESVVSSASGDSGRAVTQPPSAEQIEGFRTLERFFLTKYTPFMVRHAAKVILLSMLFVGIAFLFVRHGR